MQEWLGMALVSVGLEPLTSLRLLSLASGLVLLGVVAVLAHELGGRDAALVSLLVWVVLPFSLVYGVIGLADRLVAACFGVAMALQARLARAPAAWTALLLGLVWGVGLLTKLTLTAALWLAPLTSGIVAWSVLSASTWLYRTSLPGPSTNVAPSCVTRLPGEWTRCPRLHVAIVAGQVVGCSNRYHDATLTDAACAARASSSTSTR